MGASSAQRRQATSLPGQTTSLGVGRWRECQQDEGWHSEGDVWTHTKMVCAQLPLLEEWAGLTPHERTVLLFTALFHDSGKPLTSQVDPGTGRITSPKHAVKGEHLARSILRDLGCDLTTREEIARLVRFHGRPAFLLEKPEPSHEVVSLSWLVSNKLLYLFALADTRGRTTAENGASRGEPAPLAACRRGERLLRSALSVRQRSRPLPVLPAGAAEPALRAVRGSSLHRDD